MNASEQLLTWKKQKELIRFFVDGTGTVQPTRDEANFASDLLVLILRHCKDEHNLEKDIKKFTETRAHELSNKKVTGSEVRRIRQRYFGFLASEVPTDAYPQPKRPGCIHAQFRILRLLQQHLLVGHDGLTSSDDPGGS
ncbi:hypothetical protein [Bradyrhizobium lupini]|uniref:hypothetical protein n=1 Tax=Rhizobium lupini TaxID=136996 RepID=UPI0034C66F9C